MSTITISGVTGPDRKIVNHVLPNATKFTLDLKKKVLTVEMTTRPEGGAESRDIDLVGITNVNFTVADQDYKIKVG